MSLLDPPKDLSKPHSVLTIKRTVHLRPLPRLGPGVYHFEADLRDYFRSLSTRKHVARGLALLEWRTGTAAEAVAPAAVIVPDEEEFVVEDEADEPAEAAVHTVELPPKDEE